MRGSHGLLVAHESSLDSSSKGKTGRRKSCTPLALTSPWPGPDWSLHGACPQLLVLPFIFLATMNTKAIENVVEEFWNAEKGVMQTLEEYIRIENQSPFYDPDWASNGLQEQAAELLVAWVKRQDVKGLTVELIKEEGRTPLIFAEVAGTVDGADASKPVLLYGHFDKQPPLTDTWDADLHPYTPVKKDGKVWHCACSVCAAYLTRLALWKGRCR